MPKIFPIMAFAAVAWTTGIAVQAQPGDARYRDFGRETLSRVRADLNRAEADLRYLSADELRRFRVVRERIAEFDRNWEHGRFDVEDLNESIGSLARLVDRARLRPRDRDLLADDLRRLREMRERYERRRERYR